MAVDLTSSNDLYLQFALQQRQRGTALADIHRSLINRGLESLIAIYVVFHALITNTPDPNKARVAAFSEITAVWPNLDNFDYFTQLYIGWVQAQVTKANNFDNEETVRFKVAQAQGISHRYVHAVDVGGRTIYRTILDAITSDLQESISNALVANKNLSIEGVIFFMYNRSTVQNEDLYNQLLAIFRTLTDANDERISTYRTFLQNFQTWSIRYQNELAAEASYLDLIIESQMYLTLYTEMPHAPFEITSQVMRFWVETESDPVEIFARSQPSIRVPFISYEDDDQTSKSYVYEGDSLAETLPPFSDFIRLPDKWTRSGAIHFTINTLDDKLLPGTSNYIRSQFVLRESYIEILVANGQQDQITTILQQTFPALRFVRTEIIETRGKLHIRGLKITDHILLNLTINQLNNQPVLSRYFYIDESEAALSERKKSPKLRYRSTVLGDEIDEISGKIKGVASLSYTVGGIDTEAPFVEMAIKTREDIREQFLEIVLRAFRYYSLVEPERLAFFREAVPDGVSRIRATAVREDNLSRKKVEDINRIIPDMPDYSRACQCEHQPVIIGDDEVAEWIGETNTALEKPEDVMNAGHRHISRYYQITVLENGQETIEYDMVHFENGTFNEPPPLEGEIRRAVFNITCSGENPERPSLVERKDGNGERYPCCNKTGTIRKKKLVGKTGYHRISGSAQTGQTGGIPSTIIEILHQGDPSGETGEYVRNGMPNSSSSLIHCVLVARKDKTYLSLSNEAKIEYVQTIREKIAEQVTPWVYKQELFDVEIDQIRRNVANPDVSLDPYLYFRGVEVYFSINLFVFILSGLSSQIEIPRSRACHIRVLKPEYPTVLIAKLKENSYCELITRIEVDNVGESTSPSRYGVFAQQPGIVTGLFESEMTNHLYEVLSKSYEAVILSVGPQIEARLSPFNRAYWMSLFGNIYPDGITGQLIDPYGKTRVVEVTYQGIKVHFSVPPAQPFQAPAIEKLVSAPEEIVVALFGKPYQITSTGFWYPILDYPDGVFVLTTHSHPSMPNAPLAPIHVGDQKDVRVSNYVMERMKQRIASIIVQVIGWLWQLDGRPLLEEWWQRHILSNPKTKPIRIENLPLFRNLPIVTTAAEGIVWLKNVWPLLVGTKLNLYPALHDKLLEYFRREEEVVGGYQGDPIKSSIEGLYIWTSDFPQHAGVRFFANNTNLEHWRKQIVALHTGKTVSITAIVREVKEEMSEEIGPVFLETDEGIFIMQTVHYGELSRALALCDYWERYHKNFGRAIEPIEVNYTHVQYGIGKNSRLLPERAIDGVVPSSGFYRVVRFNQDFYAALLPLSGAPE